MGIKSSKDGENTSKFLGRGSFKLPESGVPLAGISVSVFPVGDAKY